MEFLGQISSLQTSLALLFSTINFENLINMQTSTNVPGWQKLQTLILLRQTLKIYKPDSWHLNYPSFCSTSLFSTCPCFFTWVKCLYQNYLRSKNIIIFMKMVQSIKCFPSRPIFSNSLTWSSNRMYIKSSWWYVGSFCSYIWFMEGKRKQKWIDWWKIPHPKRRWIKK